MHRRRPHEKAVYGRVTGCCGGIGKRHSDQHGKEPAGRPCCSPHGVCCEHGFAGGGFQGLSQAFLKNVVFMLKRKEGQKKKKFTLSFPQTF